MKEDIKDVINAINDGRDGNAAWIPLHYPRMGQHIGIGKKIYTLIGGQGGTGKTAFTDVSYVLAPYAWWRKNKENTDVKLRWIYRSMERSKTHKLVKWAAFKLFTQHKILIDVPTVLRWGPQKKRLTDDVYDKLVAALDYYNEMLDYVEIIDGPENPTGIYKHVMKYAENYGDFTETTYKNKDGIESTVKKYKQKDENLIVNVLLDHVGKCKGERHDGVHHSQESKGLLDLMSYYCSSVFRDQLGFNATAVSQFNRGLEDVTRRTKTAMAPLPSDFKGTGNSYNDADVVLALYNPYKLKDDDNLGYQVPQFVNREGYNRFRSCYILKNSYGIDDVGYGFNFIGEVGQMIELPRPDAISEYEKYREIEAVKY